jgi:tetratricopeptide (TPR) repeat protein
MNTINSSTTKTSSTPNSPTANEDIAGDNHLFLPNPQSNKLVLLFSGTYKNNGRFDFWNVAQRLKPEANVLLLNNGKNQWYQQGIPDLGSSLEDSASYIQTLAKNHSIKEIYTIGVSMGGFGAILLGKLLGAKVLAFGIDSLLNIVGSRSKKSMHPSTNVKYRDLIPFLSGFTLDLTLIVGEMDILDLYGASRIRELPGVKTISVRGMDHGGGRYIDKTQGLASFISKFINSEPLPELNEEGTALDSPNLVVGLYRAHCLGLEGDWEKSLSLLEPLVAQYPMSEIAHYSIGLTLLKLKRYADARPHFCFVASMTPYFISGRFYLAHTLRMEKNYKTALHLFLEQLKEKPDSAPTLFNVGCIYSALNAKDKAIEFISKAVEIKPNKKIYADQLASLKAAKKKN